jgi:hypothetical protein
VSLPVSEPETNTPCEPDQPRMLPRPCPCCGGRMIIIETFARGDEPKHPPRPLRRQLGSTPHDAVIADQRSQKRPSFLLALSRQRSSSQRFDGFTSSRSTNLVDQRAERSFTPTREPMLCRKSIAATAPIQAPHPRSRRQIPIAHAAPPLHDRPRFPALALLGRWLPQRADGLGIPASENLHKTGPNGSGPHGSLSFATVSRSRRQLRLD